MLTHFNSARGQFYFPEIMGAGAAFLDYDGDGNQDIYVVNGCSLPRPDPASDPTSYLFRNRGGGTFSDFTAATGLGVKGIFGTGVSVGDYDNDGDPDLYMTGYLRSVLLRNSGDGTFTDSSAEAGVENQGHWAASSGFFDYDRDGDLDLLVANYVLFDTQQNTVCRQGGERSYCHPSTFQSDSNVLYRNNGDATFTDVSQDSGIGKLAGKALGWSSPTTMGTAGMTSSLPAIPLRICSSRTIRTERFPKWACWPGWPTTTTATPAPEWGWISATTTGTGCWINREGIGARVRARVGERWLHRQARRAGSYLSSNDVRLHLGLRKAEQVEELEITWPSGTLQTLKDVESNQFLVIEEVP